MGTLHGPTALPVFTPIISLSISYIVACIAGGFKELGVYGERNDQDVYNIIRRVREKLGTSFFPHALYYIISVFLIALAIITPAINPQPLKTAGYAG